MALSFDIVQQGENEEISFRFYKLRRNNAPLLSFKIDCLEFLEIFPSRSQII